MSWPFPGLWIKSPRSITEQPFVSLSSMSSRTRNDAVASRSPFRHDVLLEYSLQPVGRAPIADDRKLDVLLSPHRLDPPIDLDSRPFASISWCEQLADSWREGSPNCAKHERSQGRSQVTVPTRGVQLTSSQPDYNEQPAYSLTALTPCLQTSQRRTPMNYLD